MRAAVLTTPGPIDGRPLDLVDCREPTISADEVLVAVQACAVCRTDLQICEGDLEATRLPIVPGHQVVGRVRDIGGSVTGIEPGDRVAVAWIAGTCGSCRHCRSGRENLCDSYESTGWDRDGGFAQLLSVRGDFVHRLPDSIDPVVVAPLLCGGAIGLRSLRVAGVEPGTRLGLFGFGASATCAIQIAAHWACEIFVCTRSVAEQERALDLGAVWAGGYDDRVPAPLDAAVSFAPVGSVAVAALEALDKGGVVAINAIHLDEIPAFPYDLLWGERQIRSVANVTRQDVAEVMALASSIPIRTQVDVFGLDEANEALQELKRGAVSGAAVLSLDR